MKTIAAATLFASVALAQSVSSSLLWHMGSPSSGLGEEVRPRMRLDGMRGEQVYHKPHGDGRSIE